MSHLHDKAVGIKATKASLRASFVSPEHFDTDDSKKKRTGSIIKALEKILEIFVLHFQIRSENRSRTHV